MKRKAIIITNDGLNEVQRKNVIDNLQFFNVPYKIIEIEEGACPYCGHEDRDRKIAFFVDMARALHKVWVWCMANKKYEFTRKEVKHLFTNENQTARFGDWIMFGGLVYRPKNESGEIEKGTYGLNKDRVRQFFTGQLSIPTIIIKKRVWGKTELLKESYKTIKDMPELNTLLVDGKYNIY